MKRRQTVARRLERAMDFPGGTMAKTALVEIEGGCRAVVTGCQGILSYTEDRICLRTPEGTLTFYGHGLEMGCLTVDGATVTGRIRQIEFSE